MGRAKWLREIRQMRFEEAFDLWQSRTLTQEEAAQLLGVSDRTFRRYIDRFEEDGLQALMDKRSTRANPSSISLMIPRAS